MSTEDVPGANLSNGDSLHAGCWAEHEDGSLLYVKGTEKDRVVYEMYDMSQEPPIVYTDAMVTDGFKKQFSRPPTGRSKEKWTWHDKTPFDWDRVIKRAPVPRPQHASADDLMTAAKRVADSLRLRGRQITEAEFGHLSERTVSRVRGVWDRIDSAVRDLLS